MYKKIGVVGLSIILFFIGFTGVNAEENPIKSSNQPIVQRVVQEKNTDSLFTNFVEAFKKTELVATFKEANTIDFTMTDRTLKVVMSGESGTFTTNFTYENGILSYVPSNDDSTAIADSLWITNSIYALADMKGYSIEELSNLFGDETNPTLAKNGIEIVEKELVIEENGVQIKTSIYTKFQLDIRNGFKLESTGGTNSDNKVEEPIENPNTGIENGIGIVVIGLVGIGTIVYLKMKKYNQFPQV